MSTPPSIDDRSQSIEQSLYAKREKIYPREVHGLFALLRTTCVMGLLGIFYIMPWIPWGDRPVILFDLPARKFYIFGWTLWPQDFLLLTFLLALAGLSLFFFTALAGRLWCGYACPQTAWTELFLWIERKVEGSRNQQMKLDKSPWTWRKFRIKTTKHTLWFVLSAYTGFTFVAYFSPARELLTHSLNFSLGPWELFWMVFYGFATYGNAGWMREQVCKYMCPYARFQSAMFDRDTLIISYDTTRGEPRGSRRAGSDHKSAGLGDCINCTMCVQVCPTGIDIRDGLQYECIGCSACIDVCDDVMDKMSYPKGLIRYTTQNAIDGKPSRILRPRIVIYAAGLLILSAAFFYALLSRSLIELDVIRDRNQLYREVQGYIENVYTLKVINMDDVEHEFRLGVAGIDNLQLIQDVAEISAPAGAVVDVPVRLRADEVALAKRSTPVTFTLQSLSEPNFVTEESARFIGPIQ